MTLKIVAIELSQLNDLVARLHRHHKPVQGHRFSIGLEKDGVLVAGCSVGRPVARKTCQRTVVEVTRLVSDGTPNACSMLYSAAARAAKAIGYRRIQTFTLASELGASLKASGFKDDGISAGGDWTSKSKPNRRQDQPQEPKRRWVRDL